MAHFAHVNKDNIVDAVLVINRDTLEANNGWYVNGVLCPKEEWVQTSYNTGGGEYHLGANETEKLSLKQSGSAEDIKARERKNYAGVGYTYDRVNDMFISPSPYPSWLLDKATGKWEPPKPLPKYDSSKEYPDWSEEKKNWVLIPRT